MYKGNRKALKNFLESDYQNCEEMFSKKTVSGLLRSLLEPVAASNAQSLILTRFKNTQGIEGILKRLEYCSNVEMYSFLDFDVVSKDDLVELEFVILTSHRYNAVLIWDYSNSKSKDETKLYIKMNSKDVNDVFELAKSKLKINLDEKFYSYRPERRENALLNDALSNILKMLNENIKENDFNQKEIIQSENNTSDNALGENQIRSSCHEIRNQLSILDIYSSIFEKKYGESSDIDAIKKAVLQIKLQLDDIKSQQKINFEQKNIVDVIKKSLGIFENSLLANNNKIKLIDNSQNDAASYIDEERFFAVLNNVVKNANEATKNDEIEIEIRKDEKFVKIFIRNHGEKISDEIQRKLFTEGFSTKKEGWGLGLNICAKYLEAQLGSISLTKSDEVETEFLITLPLAQKIIDWGEKWI